MIRSSCPSCDHDLSYPGKPGHECYSHEEWLDRQARARARENAASGVSGDA